MKKPLLLIIALFSLFSSIPFQVRATVFTIHVADFSFTPSSIANVMVGDTIFWTWSTGSHTTTSTGVPSGAATWSSPINSQSPNYTYFVTAPGTYTYQCNVHGASMSGSFVASTATGISALPMQNTNLKFFPNPVKADLNITFNSGVQGQGDVRLYDLTGKEVFHQQTDIITGINTLVLPVGQLQGGMYMAELRIGTELVGVRRIIKE